MIRHLAISWISGLMMLTAGESPDMLRFTNGDQLHGTFMGIKEGPHAIWQREDIPNPVEFKTGRIRHIVLSNGQPRKSLGTLSNVTLVNGDRVPGEITAMDVRTVTLETSFAGPLVIPRKELAMLAPSPLGGRLRYYGPFSADEWKMTHAAYPDGLPAEKAPDSRKPGAKQLSKADPDEPGRWVFTGSAWYWPNTQYGTALIRENAMPDRSILKFDVAWKNRLSLAIGFHADFTKAKVPEGDARDHPAGRALGFVPGDSNILPVLFGNSYVLQIFNTNMTLSRTSINEAGQPSIERVQLNGNSNSMRLGESGKATVEIRSNRLTGEIGLFFNDEFVVQWNENGSDPGTTSPYAGKGNGFGFVVQTDDTPVKISDVMVAEWNGMPDSARSLQVDDQDVVLLANGTDRFAGKVESLEGGKIHFEGKYGRFLFKLEDVAEIRFARRGQNQEKTDLPTDSVVVRLSPLGQITGRLVSGNPSTMKFISPVFGEVNFNLESAVMLDFSPASSFIDDWDVDL